MDGQLSVESIQALSRWFGERLTALAPELATMDLAGIERQLQRLSREVMGQVVEAVSRARAAALPVPWCPSCQQPMRRVVRERPRQLQGLIGDYTLRRPYFVCPHCHAGDAPLDAVLGLGSGSWSPELSRVACRLGIETSFQRATETLDEALQVPLDAETLRRVTEGIGQVAEDEVQAAIAEARTGRVPVAPEPSLSTTPTLLVAVDGTMVHRDGDWHEVKAGVIGTLGPDTEVDPATGRPTLLLTPERCCVGTEPAADFWYRVYVAACQQGLGSKPVRTVVAIGDGADWIWRHAAGFLAIADVTVVEIVDYYHATQHLWAAANAAFGAESTAAAQWVVTRTEELLTSGAAPVQAALRQLTQDPDAPLAVTQELGYFTTQAARLDYPRFLAHHWPIGSGVIESACKTLVGRRAKGGGMRWGQPGLQAVLTLRALQRSGDWDAFWQSQPQRRPPVVNRSDPTGDDPTSLAAVAA